MSFSWPFFPGVVWTRFFSPHGFPGFWDSIPKRCKGVHCVDLGESFPTHIYLQNLASVLRRTSPVKFARSPRTFSCGLFSIVSFHSDHLLLLQIPQVVAVRLMLHWLRYRFFVGALHIAVQLRSNACDKTREVWTCTNGELTILHAAAYDICDECFRAEVLFSRGADRSKHGISSMLVFNFGLSFGYCLIIHKRLQLSC